ncbi:MAG: DeoR/GlpR family DNA-binding transcription regulator [Arachnia sp.]
MLKTLRHESVLHLLQAQGSASVNEIAQHLGTSPATARRDLAELERQSLVERTWGGVRLVTEVDDPFQEALISHGAAKRRIGAAAAELVPDGATVLLDIGTTVHHVAMELADRDVTVLTASLPTFEVLRTGGRANIILLGGVWSEQYQCFTGTPVTDALERQQADIAFLGCSGVSDTGRIRDTSYPQSSIKQSIREAATHSWLLADARKFPGKGAVSPFDVDQMDGLITDCPDLPASLIEKCRTHHTEIRIV